MNAPFGLKRDLTTNNCADDDAVRVMIVDDSLTVRTIFKRMVDSAPNLHVASTAPSAEQAIVQLRNEAKTGRIDVILLDLEMPGMGGLKALPAILEASQTAQVLVVSSHAEDGAEETLQALSIGAADTMLKPRPGGFNNEYQSQLLEKIFALGGFKPDAQAATQQLIDGKAIGSGLASMAAFRPEIVAIGASTGGIHALNVMLRKIPLGFDLPILITQHLPSSFIPVFARQIEVTCGRKTVIAEDGTVIRPGQITVATGHGHMVVRRRNEDLVCGLSVEPVHSGCLPSVDPMLSSLATACDGRVLAIILSGMGRDGAEGAKELVDHGGIVFAQDAESSAVWGMPGAVAKAGLTSLIASPDQLADAAIALSSSTRRT